VNGCDAGIWIDSAAGTPTDISGSSNEYTLDFSMNVGELRNFQSRWPRRLMCGKDAKFAVVVTYTTAADEALDLLRDWFFQSDPAPRTLTFYVPDKNVGSDKYSGEAVLESLSIPVKSGDGAPIAVSASFLPDGAWTHSNVAT
jgi:hypothetical protein